MRCFMTLLQYQYQHTMFTIFDLGPVGNTSPNAILIGQSIIVDAVLHKLCKNKLQFTLVSVDMILFIH